MEIPFTRKRLVDWAGDQVLRDADTLVKRGLVLEAAYEPPLVKGAILWNNRSFNTSLKILSDGTVENLCPCYANKERGIICSHVIALGLTLVNRATDPLRESKYQAELRRSSRLAEIDESAYIQRVSQDTPGALPATLRIVLDADWKEQTQQGKTPISCYVEYHNQRVLVDEVNSQTPLAFSKKDESLLFVIEDMSEGPAKGHLSLNTFDLVNILRLHEGQSLPCEDGSTLTINKTPLTTHLQMDLDRENGELILIAHTELPFPSPGEFPLYVVSGKDGWVYGSGHFWPLQNVLPLPYHAVYGEPVVLPRLDVIRFLRQELPALSKFARVASDIALDLFTIESANPKFRLHLRGSPASLCATLYARYGHLELVAGKPDAREHFSVPDPDDIMRYQARNTPLERQALQRLAATGFRGEVGDDLTDIVGKRLVLNFLGSDQPALRREGWQVDLEGRVAPFMESLSFTTPVVRIEEPEDGNWFDVGFEFEDTEGLSLSSNEVQLAIRKGDAFVEKSGRTILIDSDAIESMMGVFSDCDSMESDASGQFRLSNIYAPFVKSSLDALDGVDLEDSAAWRTRASQQNRSMKIAPVPIPSPLEETLRSYQKEGVYWMRFLEENGFCGILADEMGLGKTIQTLAWLQMLLTQAANKGKPCLIVCPTSIVENWAEEAARFVPDLSTVILTGPDRRQRWKEIPTTKIAITSYAILRRDLDEYRGHDFSVIVLDEAQHIKNRSTQNAVAAKILKATHRLVLTGTPLENSVSDLWSIMDFLMPGYMNAHEAFRQNYELPISRGGREAELAQSKLKKKIHPFLLRRMKSQVAKDLPPKIQKVSSCSMTADQRLVYNEILKSSRQRISQMVSQKGFNQCRMEILTTLMRLRQVCCHLDLLKLPNLKAEFPSAKMDLFFELLDEALDGGHRVLVFSQFVTMLQVLRKELESRSLSYCYLDGSTKNRQDEVRRFNTQRDIPLFLISLKAGGTGLNLTGADMVIHFDPWWNPAVEDQATDRAHRIGQHKTVYCIKLITKDTVEEKVLALQKRKRALIDATIKSDDKVMQSLSWEDVQELLAL